MFKERNHIKVFVSSTVYDFESQLDVVYSTLDGYGYEVMMSHKGTIPQYWNNEISDGTAKNDLQLMVSSHLCRREGSGPATKYVVLAND